ncbi:MAG: hypothetical protein DRG31_05885 [Deltaproteobacteria bacterium]|nr:MAG: hypothetical protein DRG31_05885 [Deltaproteobacteria bacterium]
MFYLDTNVIVSYLFETDPNHGIVLNEIRRLGRKGTFHISSFSLVGLAYVVVFCFKYRGWKLIDALQIVVDGFPEQVRCRVLLGLLLGYVIQDLGVKVHGDDEVRGLFRKFRELREVKLGVLNVKTIRLCGRVVDLIRRGFIVEYSDVLRLLYA